MRLGLYDHFGWAHAVVVDDTQRAVDRRRIELVDDALAEVAAPIHYCARRLDDDALLALIARVRSSIAQCAHAAFDELPGPLTAVAMRALPATFPTDIATLRRSPYEARADAVMYREVLCDVADGRGVAVHFFDAKQVVDHAVVRFGAGGWLDEPRQRLGPPWTKEHRIAFAGATLA